MQPVKKLGGECLAFSKDLQPRLPPRFACGPLGTDQIALAHDPCQRPIVIDDRQVMPLSSISLATSRNGVSGCTDTTGLLMISHAFMSLSLDFVIGARRRRRRHLIGTSPSDIVTFR